MKEIKNTAKVAGMYLATIIGAGFASGQEIVQFFSSYYKGGFYGILLAGILFSIIGCIVLDRVYTGRIRSYEEFLFPSVGWVLGWIIEGVSTLYVLSLFSIMLAGAGGIISTKLGISFTVSVVMVSLFSMILIMTGIRGVLALGSFISPVLVAGIVLVGLYIIMFKDVHVFNPVSVIGPLTHNWVFSSIIYVSYNCLFSVVILCSLYPFLKTRRVAIAGGIMGGVLLCFVALVLNTALFIFYPGISKDMPVLAIVESYSSIIAQIYTVILFLAMMVSAVTSGFCFVDRLNKRVPLDKRLVTIALCAAAVPMSNIGFSKLIGTLYPIFGYFGMFMVFVILIQWFGSRPIAVRSKGK
ncbi:MAG TPA: hypothetical protein VF941_20260 [Clostridia bacterium]